MNASDFFREMKRIWGPQHVVERLLECSKRSSGGCHLESHWLEFKATLSPPDEEIEQYPESSKNKAGLRKFGSGDFVLHVLKAICSMMNNATGGIVLVGMDDTGIPARREALCDTKEMEPLQDHKGDWNCDSWQNWAKLKLKNPWTDRFNSEWSCSINLNQTSMLGFDAVEFQGAPVLVFTAAPSLNPVRLDQICCPGCHNQKNLKNPNTWCGWPHGIPGKPDFPKVSHVYKRVSGSIGAGDEWTIDELLERWKGGRQSDESEFEKFLREEQGLVLSLSASNSNDGQNTSLVHQAEEISRRVLRYCFSLVEPSRTTALPDDKNGWDRTVGILRVTDERDGAFDRAVSLCKTVACTRTFSGPIPFFLDLDRLTPRDWERLRTDTGRFFFDSLLMPLGCDGVYPANLMNRILDKFGSIIFVVGGAIFSRDLVLRDLFSQSMTRFLEKYAQNGIPLTIHLFGLSDLPISEEWACIQEPVPSGNAS